MSRPGLTVDRVAEAAATIIDRDGLDALTLTGVATALHVKTPSLYNHIDNLDGLRRQVMLRGVDLLADTCRAAVMGRSGLDALSALGDDYRDFARRRPGIYALTQIARPGDADYMARAERVLEPIVAVLRGYGHEGDQAIHAARALRSALHGFVLLETHAGFGLDVDPDTSFAVMLKIVDRGLRSTEH